MTTTSPTIIPDGISDTEGRATSRSTRLGQKDTCYAQRIYALSRDRAKSRATPRESISMLDGTRESHIRIRDALFSRKRDPERQE